MTSIDNVNFLEVILSNPRDYDYWVVAKVNTSRQYFEEKRDKDSILLVSFPESVRKFHYGELGTIDDLKFGDLRTISCTRVITNIFLTNGYPPFQYGQEVGDFYRGFPLDDTRNIKQFIIDALQLDSHDLSDYKELYERLKDAKEE
jgi:hypothetical protein